MRGSLMGLLVAVPALVSAQATGTGADTRSTTRQAPPDTGASLAPLSASSCAATDQKQSQVVLDGSFIRPYSRRVRQIVTNGSGTVLNARIRITDDLRLVRRAGVELYQRVITMFRFDGVVYAADTAYFAPRTLEPVETVEWVAGTLVWRRVYADRQMHISGQRLMVAEGSGLGGPPSPDRALDVRLARPVFDFYGGMDGLVAASIPHEVGRIHCVPIYMPAGDSLGYLPLRVIREEAVEAGEGRFVTAQVVETLGSNGPLRLWVTKEPPFVLKSEEIAMRNGRPWRIYTTVMVDPQP